MKTDRTTIDILVRQFFYSYFSKAASNLSCDISSAEPIAVKQLLVKNIDNLAKDFNSGMARAFAMINGLDIPAKMKHPKSFDEETALIIFTLNGSSELFTHMAERYRYHFEKALSGSIEKVDEITDIEVKKAAELL